MFQYNAPLSDNKTSLRFSHVKNHVQKKIVKVMTFNKQTTSSTAIFSNLEFLKLMTSVNLNFSLLYMTVRIAYFHKFFVQCTQIHSCSTRLASRGDLFLERKNTFQYGVRSIEYNGARLWNMVPVHIRESPSPSVFRSKLKKHFLNQCKDNSTL